MKALKCKLASAIATALILVPAAQSVADESDATVKQKVVRFTDYDLSSATGAQTLYGRLKIAARSVCSRDGITLREQERYRACVADALEEAVAAVGSPALTDAYLADVGHKPVSRLARRQ